MPTHSFFFGLTWHAHADRTEGLVLFVGFLAIIGSFLLSYTADKYDHLMGRQIRQGKGLRVGRDIRGLHHISRCCAQSTFLGATGDRRDDEP